MVRDANNVVIPGLRKNVYVGPDGVTSGQYGVFGTIIAVVTDTFGNKVVRRLQVHQESFAKYAYFTTIEGNIVFANDDQIRGPVHSNDQIEIHSSGATFWNTVTTAASSIQGEGYGTFNGGAPKKSVPAIPLPTTAAFTSLAARATAGGFNIAGNTLGASPGQASLRMEFVALDLNNDTDSTDAGEGFVRIYQNNAAALVRDRAALRRGRVRTSVARRTAGSPSKVGTGTAVNQPPAGRAWTSGSGPRPTATRSTPIWATSATCSRTPRSSGSATWVAIRAWTRPGWGVTGATAATLDGVAWCGQPGRLDRRRHRRLDSASGRHGLAAGQQRSMECASGPSLPLAHRA